ncbi:MAG: AI-2E family transporter [Eubacteriales bacterium]
MKLKLDRHYTTIAVYALLVIAFALLLGVIFLNLSSIAGAFKWVWDKSASVLYGVFFTFCFLPLVKFFERLFGELFNRKKTHPMLVSLCSAIFVDLLFVGILAVAVIGIIPSFLDAFETFRQEVIPGIDAMTERVDAGGSGLFATLYHQIYDLIAAMFTSENTSLIGSAAAFATNFFSHAYAIGVGLVLATYFLVCRRYLTAISRKLSVAILPEKFRSALYAVAKRIYYFFVEFFSYRLVSGFVLALLTYLLFLPFRIEYGIIVAVVVFVANFVPVFGPILSTVACTLLIAMLSPLWKAVTAFIILFALQFITFLFIEPFCQRKKLRPGPGTVVTSIIICYALFGFGGVLFAVPLYSSVDVAYREIQTRLLVRKGLPMTNSYYLNLTELPVPVREKAAKDGEKTEVTDETPTTESTDLGEDSAYSDEESVREPTAVYTDFSVAQTDAESDSRSVEEVLPMQSELQDATSDEPFYPIPDAVQTPSPSELPNEPTSASAPETYPDPTSLPKPDAQEKEDGESRPRHGFFFKRNKKNK